MAGIVFYFEDYDRDVYSGRRIDFDAWRYAMKSAGDIDKMIVINHTGRIDPDQYISKFDNPGSDVEFTVVENMPELDGKSIHVACPWNSIENKIDLWDFDHDVDWYLFGPSNGWAKLETALCIPQANEVALHSIHIASVVLMHRYHIIGGNS